MGKRHYPFGESAVDQLVKNFVEREGIDPRKITGYRLTRSVDDIGTISFDMIFEDQPAGDVLPASTEE